jgi:hypothetical protein
MKKLCNYRLDSDDRKVIADLAASLGTKNATEAIRFAVRLVAVVRGIRQVDTRLIAQSDMMKPLDAAHI